MHKHPESDTATTSQNLARIGEEGNWRSWYFLVLAALAVEIVGFALINSYFA